MEEKKQSVLFTNISELVTCAPLVKRKTLSQVKKEDLGIVENAWLLVAGGKVQSFGSMTDFPSDQNVMEYDVRGHLILPGLVDSHTHPLYAGRRDQEFVSRIDGMTYEEIAKKGGGIQTTVRGTREASDDELYRLCLKRLNAMLENGVTTVEAKTGYALSVDEEIRHLKILSQVAKKSKQKVARTCLALHALPQGKSALDFIDEVEKELLPVIAQEKLCDYFDLFIERGFYLAKDCDSVVQKALDLGLGLRVHADEFSHGQGAQFAAKWKAKSADHLQYATKEDFEAMTSSSTIATILPGTSLCTQIPYTQTRLMKEAGCPIAVATDHNPGSCVLDSLPLVATLSSLYCGLSYAETLAAVTYIPAVSLDLEKTKGSLAEGFDADLTLWSYQSSTQWLEGFGQKKPVEVWVEGKRQI